MRVRCDRKGNENTLIAFLRSETTGFRVRTSCADRITAEVLGHHDMDGFVVIVG